MAIAIIMALTFVALISGVGLLVWRFASSEDAVLTKLRQSGKTVEASIVDFRPSARQWFYLTYRFEVDDATYTRQEEVYDPTKQKRKRGETILISFLPDDPKVSRIATDIERLDNVGKVAKTGRSVILVGIVGAILAFFVGLSLDAQINATKAARDKALATPNQAQSTATRNSQLQLLARIRAVLGPQIPTLQKAVDQPFYSVSAASIGFGDDNAIHEVDYGHCDKDHFYLYVWDEITRLDLTKSVYTLRQGFGFTPGSTPGQCYPTDWVMVEKSSFGDDWYIVTSGFEVQLSSPGKQ